MGRAKCDDVSVFVVLGLGVGGGSGGKVSPVQVALDISQPQLAWEVDAVDIIKLQ